MRSLLLDLLVCFVAGGLLALTYPSNMHSGWLPLLFVAIPLFVWKLEEAQGLKRTLLVILFFNLGLNAVGFYWIPHTLREFGQLPYPVSVLLGLLFSLILQPHWWIYAVWRKYRPVWAWNSQKGILITALLMTLFERYVPQQFPIFVGSPWLHLAPYLGLASIFGVAAFSFVTYWISLEVVNQFRQRQLRWIPWTFLIAFVSLNALLGVALKEFFKPSKIDDSIPFKVRIVQANIGNFLKVSGERGDRNSYEEIDRRYFSLSTLENGFTPDLIVWPETAYPDTFEGLQGPVPMIFPRINQKTGAEILIGGYDEDPGKRDLDRIESVYNSSLLMGEGKLRSAYHKNILIPFGETLPFGPFNRQIVSVIPAVSLFARGHGTPKMQTRDGHNFVTPICYEILESNYMRSLLNEHGNNRFIVNHTNDSWYGDTAEPHQHLFLSKWRALEFLLPIIRTTNTGISSVIWPDGGESRRLGVGEESTLDVVLSLRAEPSSTLYQRYGIYPLLALFAVLLGLTWWREKS